MRAATARRLGALVAAVLLGLPATACGAGPPAPATPAAPTSATEPEGLPPPRDVMASGATTIAASPNQLLAVDPATDMVARTLPAPEGANAVGAGLGSVWVSVSSPGQVVRIDPASGQVTAEVDVGKGASFLAVGPDAVWVINASDATVSRIDPATNAVTATIKVSSGGISGGDIAASADAVWVRVTDDALAVRIDPRRNAVVDRLGPPAGSGGVVIAGSAVWITAHDRHSIWRLPG